MKLNEKGLKRLLDVAFDGDEFYQSNALDVEFQPDDFNFEGVVVMPVYDAKILATALTYLNGWCQESYQHDIRKLNKRIENALKSYEVKQKV